MESETEGSVHSLPPELLPEIFILTGAIINVHKDSTEACLMHRTLRLVCREWDAIVCSTKELWDRHIILDDRTLIDDTPKLKQYFDLLPNAWPLTITTDLEPGSPEVVKACYDLLNLVFDRVGSWNDGYELLSLEEFEPLQSKGLRSFTYTGGYWVHSPKKVLVIGAGRFPSLSRLNWFGPEGDAYLNAWPVWTSAIVFHAPKLEELCLKHTFLYPQTFFQQCQCSPDLRHLSLHRVTWLTAATEGKWTLTNVADEPLQLDNLNTLSLSCEKKEDALGLAMVYRIVEKAPRLTHLKIGRTGIHCIQYQLPLTNSITCITFTLRSHGTSLKQTHDEDVDYPGTTIWLERFPKLSKLVLAGEKERNTGSCPDIAGFLHSLGARSRESISNVTEIVISNCAFPLYLLSRFSRTKSPYPNGELNSTSKVLPGRISAISCHARPYRCSKKVQLKSRSIPDIESATWSELDGLFGAAEDWEGIPLGAQHVEDGFGEEEASLQNMSDDISA